MTSTTTTPKREIGFLDIYKERQLLQKTGKRKLEFSRAYQTNVLTKQQQAAFSWLVDMSFIPYTDGITKDTFVELILSKKCLCLFRIGKQFGIGVKCPISSQISKVSAALRMLFNEFLSKNIIEKPIDPYLVAGGDRLTVLSPSSSNSITGRWRGVPLSPPIHH